MDTGDTILSTLRQIIRAIDIHSKYLVKKYGLTGPQLLILKEFYKDTSQIVGQVAANVSLSQATVTSILDRLEKQGFISRVRDPDDKRKVNIKLEDKALAILKTEPNLLQEDFLLQFAKLADWEQSLLISSLQRIASMMNAGDIDSPPVLASGPLSASTQDVSDFLDGKGGK